MTCASHEQNTKLLPELAETEHVQGTAKVLIHLELLHILPGLPP